MEQELNQTGEVQEQVQEKPSEPVSKAPSADDKETSKTYSEGEWRKMQSMKDKAEAAAKAATEALQELRRRTEQERLQARQKEIADLEGDSDGQAKVRRKHQLEDELLQLQERRENEEGAVQRKYDQAMDLAKHYDLSLLEARELLDATTPKEMELMAQLRAREKEKHVKTIEPKSGETFTPDSGKADAGGEDDDTFIQRYSEGKSDDHARARKILQKMK